MRLRDPREQSDDFRPDAYAGDHGGDSEALRGEGEALLAAADDAITRALSRDSTAFLSQNRQAGGQ